VVGVYDVVAELELYVLDLADLLEALDQVCGCVIDCLCRNGVLLFFTAR
jgi:hypothetical protein